jgi:lipopolysaccharide transport protein LptA
MTKLTLARVLRLVVALTLLIVTAIILWYFLSHRRPRSIVLPKKEEIPAKKVEQQEGIEHFDFKGDRVIRAKAARHYAGEDGRYYLEGNVEVRDLGKKEGEEIVLFGERVSYDKDWTKVFLEGKAKLQYKGLTVESSAFSYLKNEETLTTDRGVTFSSRKISGKAQIMAYSFREGSLRLEREVELELREEAETGTPFVIRGDIVTFLRKRRRGQVEGNASFSFDQNRGRADSLRFELTPDEQRARSFFLKGNAQATLVGQQEPSPGGLKPTRQEREISADEIDVRAFKDRHKIYTVEARDGCILKSTTPGGQTTEVRSGRMRIIFDRREVLREFLAWSAARLVERGPTSEVERSISGEEIFIGVKGKSWKIRAPEGGEARVDSPDSDVTAKSLTIFPRWEILNAAGEVKVIVKLRPEKAETVGFFSSEQPVFGAAEKMRYDKKLDRLQLREAVRMWQGKEVLFADQLTVLKKTGEIKAEGNVRAIFSRLPKGEKATEEKIEIGGARLSFSPPENLLTFEQGCWLKSKDVGLNSDRIAVLLREKTAEIQQIEARGKVAITEELREGKGEEALYDLEQETIVLTGNPRIVDKEKGIIEGEKLTFRLGEGRIQVENKDRERSTTVIKS